MNATILSLLPIMTLGTRLNPEDFHKSTSGDRYQRPKAAGGNNSTTAKSGQHMARRY